MIFGRGRNMKRLAAAIVAMTLLLGLTVYSGIAGSGNGNATAYRGGSEHNGFFPSENSPGTDRLDLLWNITVGKEIKTTPVTDGKHVFFGTQENKFYCYDIWTGQKVWAYDLGEQCGDDQDARIGGVMSTPVLSDGKLYFGTICGKLMCLAADTGKKIWSLHISHHRFASPVILWKNYLLCVSEEEQCECVDIEAQKYLWTESCSENWYSPPVVSDGIMYLPYHNGLKKYDIAKHERSENEFFNAVTFRRPGIPAYEKGRIYYNGYEPPLVCFRADDGTAIWKKPYTVRTPICIGGDDLYFGELKWLTCADKSMGQQKWTFKTKGMPVAGPVFCDDRVYFGTDEGMFYCLNPDGKELFSFQTDSAISDTVTVGNGLVFFTNASGRLFCFGSEGSAKLPMNVKVIPQAKKVIPGQSMPIKAECLDRDGKVMAFDDITWTVSPEGAGKVDKGMFVAGLQSAKVAITACAGKACGTAVIQIQNSSDAINAITVTAQTDRVIEGIPALFTAKVYDKNGKVMTGMFCDWKVEPESAGTTDDNGMFTALTDGSCKIIASIGNVTGSVDVNIIGIGNVSVDPSNSNIVVGKSQKFQAVVTDKAGNVLDSLEPTWSVVPDALGNIAADGTFAAGDEEGSGAIIATIGKKEGRANINVIGSTNPIAVDKPMLDFGQLEQNQSKTLQLAVTNNFKDVKEFSLTSDSGWLIVSPEKTTIDAGKQAVFQVRANSDTNTAKTYLGMITVSAGGQSLPVPAKLVIIKLPDCFYVSKNNLSGELEPNKIVTLTAVIATGKSTATPVTITSSSPKVTPKLTSFDIVKNAELPFTIDTNGLKAGEKIEGTVSVSSPGMCKTLAIPFSFTVKTAKTMIWLQIGNTKAKINGKETTLSVPPQIIKGNTMVPLRFIAEAFGCKVDWNGSEKKITITRGTFEMLLWMDKTTAKVNGQDKVMKAPPTSVNGSTLVPLRFIAEAFGATVSFDSATQEIDIEWVPD